MFPSELVLEAFPVIWRNRSACLDADLDLFLPVGSTGPAEEQIRRAKEICFGCPVRPNCLDWALETRQDVGIWGGTTEDERREIRRGRKQRFAS